MEESLNNGVPIRVLELGGKYMQWREANHISLEQASEITGLSIATIQAIESGDYCFSKNLLRYNEFILEYIPNGEELFEEYMKEVLARHGYTDDDFEDADEQGEEKIKEIK